MVDFTVNIIGVGRLEGLSSDLVVGSKASVTPVAGDGYSFGSLTLNGVAVLSSFPYEFTVGSSDVFEVRFYISALDYLRGLSDFVLNEGVFPVLLAERGVSASADFSELGQRLRDLLRADLYMFLATLPSSRGFSEDADGYWRHRVAGFSFSEADKASYLRLAKSIYRRYGDVRGGSATFRVIDI